MSVSHAHRVASPRFRTSPSAIARYFFFDCERFFRYQSASPETRLAESLPTPAFDHSPLIKAILESGYLWEQTVLREHLGRRVAIAPGDGELHTRRFDWQETLRWLRHAEPDTFLYQPTLRLPRGFYERYQLDPALVVISDNHPDLIAVCDDGQGRRQLRILDLKRGEALHLTHRVQVLLYALELESVLWAESLDDLSVDLQRGEVWLGAQPAPTPFDLGELRPHLESFLTQDLLRILRGGPTAAAWHVHTRCEWCEFFAHCRDEMRRDNDLSRLTHLTSYGKQFLRDEAQVRSVPELGQFLTHPDADQMLARCASLAGRRPRLTQQVAALETNLPQTHGAASPSLSRGENIGLFLTLQQEPLTRSIYLAGLHVTARKDLREQVFSAGITERFFQDNPAQSLILLARAPAEVARIRAEWVQVLYELITQVDRYNQGRPWSEQLSLQAYVLTEQERALLISWLLESLQDAERPELAEQAMTLLFHFQAPELMVADSHPDREVPFPVVVLLDALGHVLALPVEVSYTLPEALEALGCRFRYRRNDYFHFPLGHGLRAEPIHAAWHHGRTELLEQIEQEARLSLRAARELLQGIRHQAGEAIFAWAAKFSLPARGDYADPLLSRLAFFARYESLLACLDGRQTRCEPHAVQLLLGRVLELRAGTGDSTEFEILSGSLPLEEGGFPEWLLVTDDEGGRKAQLEYRDYACRARLWQGQPQPHLAVVGVVQVRRDKLGLPTGLNVEYAKPFAAGGPEPGQRFLLYPRFTDFTTDGVVGFLQSYGAICKRLGEDELFLNLLREPLRTCQPQPGRRVAALAGTEPLEALADELHLTASQSAAFREICQRRVVPVWGPPGTGKTHFLASVILGLATAHARAGRPFRVLVTAFTHAAIENLLRKVSGLLSSVAGSCELRIAKAKAWHGYAGDSVEVLEPARLPDWLGVHAQAVVGATVHALLKTYAELPEFDLVVIDEASQVRVPEAAVPISLAGRAGRVVLAGDHWQLPPIIKGVYPEPRPGQPVLHRSIFEAIAGERQDAATPPTASTPASNGHTSTPSPRYSGARGEAAIAVTREFSASPSAPSVWLAAEQNPGYRIPGTASSVARQLTENFRMNDVLTSFAAGLLYGPAYRPVDAAVARRRLALTPERCLDDFAEACLDPDFPLVVVVLDGVWAGRENPLEARLVAKLVTALRSTLRGADGKLYANDEQFWRSGVFLVSPHRAQIRLLDRELRQQRMWQRAPFVDTVDKTQGQEADAVIVSYGVSDPEFAVQEAEFIYGLNRLNVAVTRARSKCVVFLPRALLDASPQVLERPAAIRGMAFMRDLVSSVARCGESRTFELDEGASAAVHRVATCFRSADPAAESRFDADAQLRELIDDSLADAAPKPKRGRTARKPRAKGLAESGDLRSNSVARSETGHSANAEAESCGVVGGAPASAPAATDGAPASVAALRDGPLCEDVDSARIPGILAKLNPQQRLAAMHGQAPLLIIAGAGTGKTTTLVHRVAHLISQGVPPYRILLLTFTRRAAAEMAQRVASVLRQQDVSRQVWGGTFHAVGARLLRMYGSKLGLDPRFSIHDRGDAESLMQAVCQDLELANGDKKFPKKGTCMSIHSYQVNAELSLYETLATQFAAQGKYAEPLEKLFAAYAEQKMKLSVFDYDDLLQKWCELLEHEETGPSIRERFDCVLVDEFQDTNRLQSRLLRGLCPEGRGLTVVGDDAQSIYSFRAATIRNILDFPKQFPGTRVVTLEQNYRSTQPILAASNRVIAEARERFTKDLWSQRAEGPPPQLVTCDDEHEQVDFVVQRILEHRRQGVPLAQQAVLFRSAHHSILLEAELARQSLPFVKYGGLKFVEAAHVKDVMSFLRLAENPRDRVASQRVLTLLPGIGPKKAEQLQQVLQSSAQGFAVWADAKLPPKAAAEWPQMVTLLEHLANSESAGELPMQVRSVLAFYEPLMEGRFDNVPQRLKDLEEVQQLASRFADRMTMLAELALDPPDDADLPDEQRGDQLVLSTLHSAKGLEWKVVYVLHATDGKIPHERSFGDPEQLEEERRMLYVALTRAADWLYVCHPRREASSYGNSWMGSVYEQTTLTRFITKSGKHDFQQQSAAGFAAPVAADSAVREAERGNRERPVAQEKRKRERVPRRRVT